MYYVTLDLPNVVGEAEVEIPGVGILVNGEVTEVDKSVGDTWVAQQPIYHETAYAENEDGSKIAVGLSQVAGPTFLEYLRSIQGIEVSTSDPRVADKADELKKENTVSSLKEVATDLGVDPTGLKKDDLATAVAKEVVKGGDS